MKIGRVIVTRLPNAFAFALPLLALFSCASVPENAIVGRWNALDGSGGVVFSKNGTITSIDKDKSELVIGSYRFTAENRVQLDSNGKDPDFKSSVATVSVSNNELTMISPAGKSEKYRKAD